MKTTFESFLNEGNKINKTYADFVESLYPFDAFFDALDIEVDDTTSSISFSFSLSLNGYTFSEYIPCLKYDTPEYIMENVILTKKRHFYNLYLKNAFMDFIKSNGVINDDLPVHKRLYVYKDFPLMEIPFNNLNYKNGSQNYNRLVNVKLFDSLPGNRNYKNLLFRVK